MWAIYKRELAANFVNPIGYVFIAVYLTISGALFSATTLFQMSSDITSYFSYMLFAFVVLLPLLTMRSFSEERKTRTEQLILTSPVTLFGVVVSKFFAAMTIFASCQLVSSLAFIALLPYAKVKMAVFFGNLLAVLLVGMAFIAIGIFVSAITENQLAAAVGTVGILLVLLLVGYLNEFINAGWIRFLLDCVSIWSRFQNFGRGVFDVAALFYYLSVSFVFLLLTVRIYDRRRNH